MISDWRAETAVKDTLSAIAEALEAQPPDATFAGLPEHLHWTVRRLLDGSEIGEPKHR